MKTIPQPVKQLLLKRAGASRRIAEIGKFSPAYVSAVLSGGKPGSTELSAAIMKYLASELLQAESVQMTRQES